MDECFCPNADIPIRQGDVFRWNEDDSPQSGRYRLGVVLTADCDIANEKCGASLAYLPILGLSEYVSDVLVNKKLNKQYAKYVQKITTTIHRYHQAINSAATPLSREALERWLLNEDPEKIALSLALEDPKKIKELEKMSYHVGICMEAIESDNSDLMIHCLLEFQRDNTNGDRGRAVENIRNQIKSELNDLPQDSFFVGSIPSINQAGFVVMLRQVRAAQLDSLTTSASDKHLNPGKAIRIARLTDVYKYALTQKFAMLFSRIGMPVAYEEFQDFVISETCNEVIKYREGGGG